MFIARNRRFRDSFSLSRQFRGVLSGGEIHRLLRLRNEGIPEFLSRSCRLVRRSVAPSV